MQARLHKSDLIGMLLEAAKDKRSRQFVRIVLAAVNDDGQSSFIEHTATNKRDYLPAYASLWPEQYSRAKLDEIRFMGGDFYWNCQYQQRPSLGELAIFNVENLPRYSKPHPVRTWWAWDTANTKEGNSAYSAGALLSWSELGRYELLRVVRGRYSFADIGRNIFFHALDAAKYFGNPEAVLIERAASGFGLIDELHRTTNLPIVPVIPRGSKFDRAASFSNIVNHGGLAIPEEAPWLDAWLNEMADFPLSDFMDQVDATVHALSYLERTDIFGTDKHTLGIVMPTDPREMTEQQLAEHMEYIAASTIGDWPKEDW
jgi:predicted phage terminase large subunit-like protein